MDDLHQTIASHRESLTLHPPGHPNRPDSLMNLANAIYACFEQMGGMDNLEEAIALYRQSLVLRSPGHPSCCPSLTNLASAILTRFEQTGEMDDLEEAVVFYRQSLHLRPPDHPGRSISLMGLANVIFTRFLQMGEMADLEEAITLHRQSLHLRSADHPGRSASLMNLASAIRTRFEQAGEMEDLEEAITLYRESLDLRPEGHPGRSDALRNLASAIRIHFEQTSNIEDLEEAIALHRESLHLLASSHPNRPVSLMNLANAIFTRFRQTGKAEDLGEAITFHRQSLQLLGSGHPNRSISLMNLANALRVRFEQVGKMEDLEEAIVYYHESLHLYPAGHPERSDTLMNLASGHFIRFNRTGEIEDLEEAITLYRQSLQLHLPGHPNHILSSMGLANAVCSRFEQTGMVEDLEEAITLYRQSLHLFPPGNPSYSLLLMNIANAISTRFEQTGNIDDLEEAILFYRQSLKLHPPGHPSRLDSLTGLAGASLTRLMWKAGETGDLEEAITLCRQSLDLCHPGHPGRSSSLMYLASAIYSRFLQMGELEILEEAITFYRESLHLRPLDHPSRPHSLVNLANAIHARYNRSGSLDDLHEATRHFRDALISLPTDHPMRAQILSQLAAICLEEQQRQQHPSDDQLSSAFTLYQDSANHHTAGVQSRFAAAQEWASAARRHKHSSTISAHSTVLTLLDRFLIMMPNVESQREFLATFPESLASDAASDAIEAGQPDIAVEFLERGRGIILSKMGKYRHPLEELRSIDQELAEEFETLSAQLERNAIFLESGRKFEGTSVPLEVRQQRHRILTEKWEGVVERIRNVAGFADFLQTIPFTTLRKAGEEGPVIVINVSRHRSDAIIVRDVEAPVVVPLPDASPDDLARLSKPFYDPRASHGGAFSRELYSILRELWSVIVYPVTEQLVALGVKEKTRIWWCPTSYSCALPLHAAGPYLSGTRCLPDLFISSYTSTLSTLITARRGITPRSNAPNLLVVADVGQPGTLLANVEEEIHRIKSFGDFVNVLFGEAASPDNVISGLTQHSWAHFSCHGHRNTEPFRSSFQLYAGARLELLDLIKARLPNAEHAFLSACRGAATDIQGAPDEVLHLAGALQFCGFRSVVGTMWAMADVDGPDVAADFYGYMFREPGKVNVKDSAAALNFATKQMRRRKVTVGRWVNFIHIGA